MKKPCTKCNIEKDLSNFHKRKGGKFGLRSYCKECAKVMGKKYVKNNKKKRQETCKKYYKNNKDKIKKYIKNNRDKINKNSRKYRINNKNKINQYKYNRYHNDLEYKIIENIRSRLRKYLDHNKIIKTNMTIKSIGLDKKIFSKWIEFNLRLDNLQSYHLDHFIPLSSFNCKTYQDVIDSKCNHWTNINPMTGPDNLEKGDRIPTTKEKIKMDLRYFFLSPF